MEAAGSATRHDLRRWEIYSYISPSHLIEPISSGEIEVGLAWVR